MIELLLRATRYRTIFTPQSCRRHVLMPGCFAEMLGSRPPFLALEHSMDASYGSLVGWDDNDRELRLVMRTGAPAITARVRGGWTCDASPGWKPFDVEDVVDDEGELRIVHSAHLFEVSLVRSGAMPGAGPVAWREVR